TLQMAMEPVIANNVLADTQPAQFIGFTQTPVDRKTVVDAFDNQNGEKLIGFVPQPTLIGTSTASQIITMEPGQQVMAAAKSSNSSMTARDNAMVTADEQKRFLSEPLVFKAMPTAEERVGR